MGDLIGSEANSVSYRLTLSSLETLNIVWITFKRSLMNIISLLLYKVVSCSKQTTVDLKTVGSLMYAVVNTMDIITDFYLIDMTNLFCGC